MTSSPYRKEIFPISIYHSTVENHQRLKSLLIPYILNEMNIGNKKETSAPKGWFTDNLVTSFSNKDVTRTLWNPQNDVGAEVRYQFLKLIDSFFVDYPWSIDCDHIWYNYYINGEWQESHKHLSPNGLDQTHFAFVYFLSYNSKIHSPLIFNDPIETIKSISPTLDPSEIVGKYKPKVKEGDVLMFPAYLEHEVRPGKPTPNYPRMTLAMNIKVKQYGKDGEDDD